MAQTYPRALPGPVIPAGPVRGLLEAIRYALAVPEPATAGDARGYLEEVASRAAEAALGISRALAAGATAEEVVRLAFGLEESDDRREFLRTWQAAADGAL